MDWRTRREWLIEKRRQRLTEIRKIGKTERRENWLEKKWQTGLESREERKKRSKEKTMLLFAEVVSEATRGSCLPNAAGKKKQLLKKSNIWQKLFGNLDAYA